MATQCARNSPSFSAMSESELTVPSNSNGLPVASIGKSQLLTSRPCLMPTMSAPPRRLAWRNHDTVVPPIAAVLRTAPQSVKSMEALSDCACPAISIPYALADTAVIRHAVWPATPVMWLRGPPLISTTAEPPWAASSGFSTGVVAMGIDHPAMTIAAGSSSRRSNNDERLELTLHVSPPGWYGNRTASGVATASPVGVAN